MTSGRQLLASPSPSSLLLVVVTYDQSGRQLLASPSPSSLLLVVVTYDQWQTTTSLSISLQSSSL